MVLRWKGSETAYMTQLPVTPANFPVHRAVDGTNSARKNALYRPVLRSTGTSSKVPGSLAPPSSRP